MIVLKNIIYYIESVLKWNLFILLYIIYDFRLFQDFIDLYLYKFDYKISMQSKSPNILNLNSYAYDDNVRLGTPY